MDNRSLERCLVFTIVLSLLLFLTSSTFAKDKIIWPYVCFKPLYICKDGQLADGAGFHVLNVMQQNLPDYEHELLQMPIKRILESGKNGDRILFYGLYKTPERESFLNYSLPCRISTPTYLVIRKEDVSLFTTSKQVSLKTLLNNQSLTFLYFQSVSFGKGIDEILENSKEKPNVLVEYDTTNMTEKSLNLLINKRVDYMLSLDGTGYDAREMGIYDEITYLSIKEQNQYDLGYIVAPKNEWGQTIIKQVNEVLRREVSKESFFQFFTPLVDKLMLPELKKNYDEKIVKPSLQ
ncbi:MAG: hypothetical protein D6B25_18170 [Desulfobulbaceae bacterium]|nr:MAG: hypothetical protein D6B25_18170 [Desulfobulbaceae bacterium]